MCQMFCCLMRKKEVPKVSIDRAFCERDIGLMLCTTSVRPAVLCNIKTN